MYRPLGETLPFKRLPISGLGASYTMYIAGQGVEINVPFEEVAKQAATVAINAAMTPLKAQLPSLIASAVPALKSQMPALVSAALPPVKAAIPELLKAAEPPLEDYINTRLWPNVVRPIVEGEIGKGTVTIGTHAKKAGMLAGGVLLAGVAAFLLLAPKQQVTL